MTPLAQFDVIETDLETLSSFEGKIAILVADDGKLDQVGRRLNRLTKGALVRFLASPDFENAAPTDVQVMGYPTGTQATAILVAKLARNANATDARSCGVALSKAAGAANVLLAAGNFKKVADIAEGCALRHYKYQDQKSEPDAHELSITVMANKTDGIADDIAARMAVVEGVFFTRDLVSAPANVLTTTTFAKQLSALSKLGVTVEVLTEAELKKLGMRTLLCVGQGSASPSKVVVMQWNGGGEEAPFALVGKGVVFDTGGISLKPAGGMEDMTMDMGGAGVVAGAMKALALRGAKANVVGVVGLVENMPSGNAVRPGDVIKSMKGDTVEVINTDAEGRLVLADILWYTQERFNPTGMINLATLTGAIIIGLGHEMAGVFSNDDTLSKNFISAATTEGEGAWRMPLASAYDRLIKSKIADIKNVGGRAAGSITAGQFLQRFVKDDMPWAHLDIAGVASVKEDTAFAPAGATGWGVRALNRFIADNYEISQDEPEET
ncbi:MAG: leucyl aminopeptidase [Planktomarina sp.]